MKKKRFIFAIIFLVIFVLIGIFLYFREYRTLPELAMSFVPEAIIPSKGETVLIFAPHSDDEVLGPGGFIAKSIQNGTRLLVVLITNGDGQTFSTRAELRKIYPKPENYIESGYTRQDESKKALKILGVSEENIIFLGYPDHGLEKLLTKNWQIPYKSPFTKQSYSPYKNSYRKEVKYTGENLEDDIVSILEKYSPDVVIAPHPLDIHPDHSAASIFVQKGIARLNKKPELYFYLIHFKNFPNPKGLHKDRLLTPPIKLVSLKDGWLKVSLDGNTLLLKEKAILEYKSQFKNPFLKELMESFLRQNELLSKAT